MVLKQLTPGDIKPLTRTFATPLTRWMPWGGARRQFQQYWQEQQAGRRVMLIAWCDERDDGGDNEIAGYVNVLWQAQFAGFLQDGIPEINDLVVLEKYRRRGIGTALIEKAEQLVAAQGHDLVGLGCGDTAYYQAARRLYARRGYAPYGSNPQKTPWGLMTYMTKNLSEAASGRLPGGFRAASGRLPSCFVNESPNESL